MAYLFENCFPLHNNDYQLYFRSEIAENGESMYIQDNRKHSKSKKRTGYCLMCFVFVCTLLFVACVLLVTALVLTLKKEKEADKLCLTDPCIQTGNVVRFRTTYCFVV